MNIEDHPGFMRYKKGLFEVLHADWPAYPMGHDWQLVLQFLSIFPRNTHFRELDDIDQCLLLIAEGKGPCLEPKGDMLNEKWFHVAIWRDDLMILYEKGYISGIRKITSYRAAIEYYNRVKDFYVESDDGMKKIDLPIPTKEDFDDEIPNTVQMSEEGITVSNEGIEASLSLSRSLHQINSRMAERTKPLLEIAQFDTAVREAGVLLENELRKTVGSQSYGMFLVDDYYQKLCSMNAGKPNAFIKVFRSELRVLFKFVRNDFAHALRDINEVQSVFLIDRLSSALETINEIDLRLTIQSD